MKLSIIIVNYNTLDLLRDCIESIKNSISQIDYEIIVVDNNSIDGSVELLKSEYSEVKIIENNYNAGFSRANNQGYAISQGEYVLLMNSDTVAREDSLNRLVDFLDKHQEAALVGPRLLNTDLTLQPPCRRGFPRFINSLAYFCGLGKVFSGNRILGSYTMSYKNDKETHEVDAVSGACLMIRRSIVEQLGKLLDEDFFMHFEDIDLCFRVKKLGQKVYYKHDAEVVHLKGQSSKLRRKYVIGEFYKSAKLYFKKNYKAENPIAYYFLVFSIVFIHFSAITIHKVKHFGRKT